MKVYKGVTKQYTETFNTEHSMYFQTLESAKEYIERTLKSMQKLCDVKVSPIFRNEGNTHFLRFDVKRKGFPQTTVSFKALERMLESDYTFEIPFAIVEIDVH